MRDQKLEVYNYRNDVEQTGDLRVVILTDTDLNECQVHACLMFESQVTSMINEYQMSQVDTFDTVYCDQEVYIHERSIVVMFEDDLLQNCDLINTHMLNMPHFIKQLSNQLMNSLSHVTFDLV